MITAFTAAHSITLTLATLGHVSLPGAPVEALIALSIVLAAAEAEVTEAAGAMPPPPVTGHTRTTGDDRRPADEETDQETTATTVTTSMTEAAATEALLEIRPPRAPAKRRRVIRLKSPGFPNLRRT